MDVDVGAVPLLVLPDIWASVMLVTLLVVWALSMYFLGFSVVGVVFGVVHSLLFFL